MESVIHSIIFSVLRCIWCNHRSPAMGVEDWATVPVPETYLWPLVLDKVNNVIIHISLNDYLIISSDWAATRVVLSKGFWCSLKINICRFSVCRSRPGYYYLAGNSHQMFWGPLPLSLTFSWFSVNVICRVAVYSPPSETTTIRYSPQ